MNEFLGMLTPLETLPNWPKAQEPSTLEVLGLLVGAPLVVILIVALLSRIHHAVRGNMGVPGVVNGPIWVNGERVEPSTQDRASQDAIGNAHQIVGDRMERDGTDAESEENVGGASARW